MAHELLIGEKGLIGRLVYLTFQPFDHKSVGVIVEDLGQVRGQNGFETHRVKVQWLTGRISPVDFIALKDFESLLKDYEEKTELLLGFDKRLKLKQKKWVKNVL